MNDAKTVFLYLMLCIFWATLLHMQYLLPTCCTVSLFVTNYCSDMFCRPQFLVIFRELASLLAYKVVSKIFWTEGVKIVKLTIRPVGRRHPRSSSLPHVDIGSTVSTTSWKSLSIRVSSTLCDLTGISSMVSNQCPFSFNFIFGSRKKSHGVKSEEYSGWGMTAISFFSSVQCRR